MKNKIFTLISMCMFLQISYAQEYKITQSTGTLELNNVNVMEIVGYDGKEIIFSADLDELSEERSERAKGLKRVNSQGLEDNSGIGLSVKKENGNIVVSQVSTKMSDNAYTIKIPRSMSISYDNNSFYSDLVSIKNINGEIELSSNYSSVKLTDVTGPMAIKTIHGSVESIFNKVDQANSISLYSVYGFVDVSIPSNTKANLNLSTTYGEIFTDMSIVAAQNDLAKESKKKVKNKVKNVNSGEYEYEYEYVHENSHNSCHSNNSDMTGTINGGGVDLVLNSTYSDVYLRKK